MSHIVLTKKVTVLMVLMSCFVLTIFCSSASALPAGSWTLKWRDEFNGTSINTSKWGYGQLPWGGYHHNGQYGSYVTAADSYVSAGQLVLRCRYDANWGFGGYQWSQGFVWSKQWFNYGYFEIRAKYPKGKGVWPAFWMLSGGWPPEIDIAEYFGTAGYMHHGYCYGSGTWISKKIYGNYDYWANWGLEWANGKLVFTKNGQVVHSVYSSNVYTGWMYVLLNSGMDWSYDSTTPKPNYYQVHYFRYYEKN